MCLIELRSVKRLKWIFKNLIEWKVVKGLQVIAMSRIELKAEKSLICGWTGV